MQKIKAIGFDLFNTLITMDPHGLNEANSRLMQSLRQSGFAFGDDRFKQAYRAAYIRFLEESRRTGRETHNRFWVSAALESQGYNVPPDDTRIAAAVDEYFSAFCQFCFLLPGTQETLGVLKESYRLGLLSNFTHGPAAREIIERVGLKEFFEVILISGELGYRKPHPLVFDRLIEHLSFEKDQILFVGDDLEADITGAKGAGIQPVWTTHVLDHDLPIARLIPFPEAAIQDNEVPRISNWEDLLAFLDRR
jgi:putative hydrolase of the HAD superfamily